MSDVFPLSEGQKSLWFMHQSLRNSSAHHIALAVRILSPLDVNVMREVLQALLDRNPLSRATFFRSGKELRQQIVDSRPVVFERVDISGWPEERLQEGVKAAYARPFDLAGQLTRAHVFTNGERRDVLLVTIHHIVFDGVSMFTLLSEIQELYGAAVSGAPASLRPLKTCYLVFVEWQAQRLQTDGHGDCSFWQPELENTPNILDLPTDHSRPPHSSGKGGSVVFELPDGITEGLRQLANWKRPSRGEILQRHPARPYQSAIALEESV